MMDRRRVLTGMATAPLALAAPGIIRRANAESVLDVAAVYSLSGTFANVGSGLNDGSKWAIEQYGSAAGHKLNYVLLDDRGDAGEAVRKVQEAMTRSGKNEGNDVALRADPCAPVLRQGHSCDLFNGTL